MACWDCLILEYAVSVSEGDVELFSEYSLSLATSNGPDLALLSLSLTLEITRLWSLPMSVWRITYQKDFSRSTCCLSWCCLSGFCCFHLVMSKLACGCISEKKIPPITKTFSSHMLTSLSPLFVISPTARWPPTVILVNSCIEVSHQQSDIMP